MWVRLRTIDSHSERFAKRMGPLFISVSNPSGGEAASNSFRKGAAQPSLRGVRVTVNSITGRGLDMGVSTMRGCAVGLATAAAAVLLAAGPAQAEPMGQAEFPGALAPVAGLDVERYAGTWYQLAAVPQPFNLDCARDTRATYGVRDSANVSVSNSCTTWAGGTSGIEGNARVNDPVTNAQLHVSFPSVPFQSGPEGPTNYVVTYIADDYSWALVGDPARTSGFVLSRTPAVDDSGWTQIRQVVESRGYNSCLLLTSPTTGGRDNIQPLCTV
ncbi:putative bacterial lipocalin protein [Rhodococcus sp. WAY2]|nr:putative bacterial lipocalin protein [Rhodococcus sp. WAY2]